MIIEEMQIQSNIFDKMQSFIKEVRNDVSGKQKLTVGSFE